MRRAPGADGIDLMRELSVVARVVFLSDYGGDPAFIFSVSRVGYRMDGAVVAEP